MKIRFFKNSAKPCVENSAKFKNYWPRQKKEERKTIDSVV
jgi:hypothetical protein